MVGSARPVSGDTDAPQPRVLRIETHHHLLAPPVEPAMTIRSGETIVVETIDAFGGQIQRPGDRRDRDAMPLSNWVTGPIAVEGSEPGDSVRIEVHEIEPATGQCATYLWPYEHVVAELGSNHEHQTKVCRIDQGWIHWSQDLRLIYRPMIGVIATAPIQPGVTSEDAGDFGGNLDLQEVRPGSTVWLPVERPGAMLMIGDCHASQGDGEIGGAALEMAARVTITVHVERGHPTEGPRVTTRDELMAVATGLPIERTVSVAYGRLARWLEKNRGATASRPTSCSPRSDASASGTLASVSLARRLT